MKAQDIQIADLVGKKDVTFLVPPYQRKYQWTFKKEVETLLDDVEEFINSNNKDYFLGSIVIKSSSGLRQNFILVDGQQRITTFLLAMAALKERLKNENSTLKLRVDLILETETDKFKLNRIKDQEIVQKIIQGQAYLLDDHEQESSYFKVFKGLVGYFNDQPIDWIDSFFTKGLSKIKLAVIDLDENEDEFLVFESINSKGKSLSAADLIKNYIMMNCDEEQEHIFENDILARISEDSILDLYRQLLAIKTGKLLSKNGKQLYYQFKELFPKELINSELIEYLRKSVRIWRMINFSRFGVTTLPFTKGALLNFYAVAHVIFDKNSVMNSGKLEIRNPKLIEDCFSKIAGLLVRRALQGAGRVESNRTFAKMAHDLNDTNGDSESFQNVIVNKMLTSNTNARVLSDVEIRNKINNVDIYNINKNVIFWAFVALESGLSQKHVDTTNMSVEHIYPQNPGGKWNDNNEMKSLVNTLGNLSITNDNSALSNRDILFKKKILEERSYLKINKFIYQQDNWTEVEIKERASQLLDMIFKTWPL